jgi:ceramide glucosyltransferase
VASLALILTLIGVVASLAYYAVATVAALRFARRAAIAPPPLPKIAPRVAMLKPLHGLSASLFNNVVSCLELDDPRKEFVFGVSDYGDRAAEVPVSLKPRYQVLEIGLAVGEEPNASNRKVAKLIKMAERAPKAEVFVLSDADVAVERDHLRRVVGEISADDKIGVVTCAYRAKALGGFASRLEAAFVNTDFAPMAILSEAIEPMRHAFGATIAVKRAALDAIGGFAALKDLLADDFYLGRMVAERGYQVKLSSSIVTLTCEESRFAQFWHHQLRWARTYRTVRPESLATIIINGPLWAMLMVIASGFSLASLGILAGVVAARVTMAAVVVGIMLRVPEALSDLWIVPIKDLIMAGIWCASLAGNEVDWGGRRFRLLGGGRMEESRGS